MTMPEQRSCSLVSHQVNEPMAGTAPPTVAWLLIEQDGAWGADAMLASGLAPQVAASLANFSGPQGQPRLRTQLIRRPAGAAPGPHTARRIYLVHSGATSWIERFVVEHDDDLLELPLAAAFDPQPSGLGELIDHPLILVCTHASRDRCCAEFGRPVVEALCAAQPRWDREGHHAEVWETSHTGGHRFAANVVMLPEGLFYGRLEPSTATAVVRAHFDGRITGTHLRGRSSLDGPIQAAEVAARGEFGIDAPALEVVSAVTAPGPDGDAPGGGAGDHAAVEVTMRIGGRLVVQSVSSHDLATPTPASCGAEPKLARVWVAGQARIA